MRRSARCAMLLLLGSLPVSAGAATSGVCTISRMVNLNLNLGLNFPMIGGLAPQGPVDMGTLQPLLAGFQFPVEFDEAAGTFSIKRDAWATAFAPYGARYITIGVSGWMKMAADTVMGTIDGGGNISFSHFPLELNTDFNLGAGMPGIPGTPLPVDPVVTTGIHQTSIGSDAFPSVGTPLDFSTGKLVLAGTGILKNAPGSNGDNATGLKMACTLDKIPVQKSLPKGPTLSKIKGKVQINAATAAGPNDSLQLKAKLTGGKAPLTLDGTQDFFLRLAAGGKELALLYVGAGKFQSKGKKLIATRDDACTAGKCKADGTSCTTAKDCSSGPKAIEAFAPDATDADLEKLDNAPVLGAVLSLVRAKTAATISTKLQGLSLGGLSGTATLAVTVGTQNAAVPVKVKGTGSKRSFH